MSEPMTALGGAVYDGVVTVREAPATGMVLLRADLSDSAVQEAVRAVIGLSVPGQRGTAFAGSTGLLWLSPDEMIILGSHAESRARVAALDDALGSAHALVCDVSDARAVFTLEGRGLREILAKLAPVDMAPDRFAPGEVRRTRLAQVAAAFWLRDEASAQVICFRSVAQYVFDLLSDAADPANELRHFPR
ncbi:sarcosine oxidase subunit gamma [Cognatishimia sp. F0-27]|uniref:sarcosine oxidase subunit gamma n=1 Tax=Cognatishimia sp. F0-27 TaxID=2816855 RepID=UPI001D0BFBC4|nr:sarcosine oxidase subunit gamma family protein [Cognatishimia sp. F0-27]MCC1494921.1 sarcosine oxidase subunit gamma [Cognatishimia sp. F0-27]